MALDESGNLPHLLPDTPTCKPHPLPGLTTLNLLPTGLPDCKNTYQLLRSNTTEEIVEKFGEYLKTCQEKGVRSYNGTV